MTQGYNAGQPIETALSPAAHGATNHAGLPGVGDLTAAAHASTNHAGIPGVGDLTTAAHALVDHASIPGVLSPTAHLLVDHAGIPGVGGSTILKQQSFTLTLLAGGFGPSTLYTIPAGTLAADGDSLELEVWHTATGSLGDPINLFIGGQNLISGETTPTFGGYVIYRIRVLRTGASAAKFFVIRDNIAVGAMAGASGQRSGGGTLTVSWASAQTFAVSTVFTGGATSIINYQRIVKQAAA